MITLGQISTLLLFIILAILYVAYMICRGAPSFKEEIEFKPIAKKEETEDARNHGTR